MSIGQCCLTKTFHDGTPTGKIIEINETKCYITGDISNTKKIYILFTDIFGYQFKNSQLVADLISGKSGYFVIIPDLFQGDAVDINANLQVVLKDWFPKHPITEIIKDLKPLVKTIKETYQPDYLVGAGYCFGAPIVLTELAEGGYLDAGAIAHPTNVSTELMELVKKPLIISAAQIDPMFPSELRHKCEDILISNEIVFESTLFAKVAHGFSIKGDLNDENVYYSTNQTFNNQVSFFKRFE